ncbi:hypothetical protein KIN20_027923 [Parelaphostrongylus tenuis]|uniref:Uncharacterized protein n=1 Tax=Parelaphostrongylus tenuis TaxID=148309 RepID=A0AAD5R099_PARTN|nr:hypothetical protein KIN20_008391 [Parelaphostrongylus tenuis]KAJ1364213.1 hypothetical protein KIN20_024244 [Parelaphostrongylus tenuis]KAJ1364219.1 hypothetical protein KIN20_024250 [Parelaphostrongylus tenuis]KAJ1367073.1 hypothetical protein KIN20_027922 [Parelaphostrongylus tenuis]KAJ1367074.1 hypothetical protein KIN20_027923 [Parelaphostrongylus tenuis]
MVVTRPTKSFTSTSESIRAKDYAYRILEPDSADSQGLAVNRRDDQRQVLL